MNVGCRGAPGMDQPSALTSVHDTVQSSRKWTQEVCSVCIRAMDHLLATNSSPWCLDCIWVFRLGFREELYVGGGCVGLDRQTAGVLGGEALKDSGDETVWPECANLMLDDSKAVLDIQLEKGRAVSSCRPYKRRHGAYLGKIFLLGHAMKRSVLGYCISESIQ